MKIGIVVGEVSGDLLGAALIQTLKKQFPNLIVEGVLGPKLIAEGAKPLFSMSELSIMGLVEALIHVPRLYFLRRRLIAHFKKNPPDVFIGIDAPDFNLGLETRLRALGIGIRVVHYVSPSIWAWRAGRIKTIKKAVDLMLTLFPFETEIYEKHQIPAHCTGHPFADQIPLDPTAMEKEVTTARAALGFSAADKVIGLFPGSRNSELEFLGKTIIETAAWCYQRDSNLKFVVAVVSDAHRDRVSSLDIGHFKEDSRDSGKLSKCPMSRLDTLPITYIVGNARRAMAACDLALVASGTATLELLFYKKPMVVLYKTNPITYQIAKRLIKLPYIALPNILSKSFVVPEFLQADATPENLGPALLEWLENPERRHALQAQFTALHQALRKNAAEDAARAVVEIFNSVLYLCHFQL